MVGTYTFENIPEFFVISGIVNIQKKRKLAVYQIKR